MPGRGSTVSAVYLIVCENEKEGEFSCKENSPQSVEKERLELGFF